MEKIAFLVDLMRNVDRWLFYKINHGLANPVGDVIFPLASKIANDGIIWLAIALAVLWREKKQGVNFTLLLVFTLVTSYLLVEIIKGFTERERPFLVLPDARLLIPWPKDTSFPSGHALTSFACALLLARRYRRTAPLFYLLALTVAISRVYVGVHFPLDVAVGAGMGYCYGLIIYKWSCRLLGL